VKSLLTPRRLRLYPFAILAGVVIGYAYFLASSHGLRAVRGGRIGGDFPAFYGAARIVRAGAWQSLYDPVVQSQAQADLLPDSHGGWLPFAYPPFVAVAYVPFTFLGFKSAYIVHAVLMTACAVAALAFVLPLVGAIRRDFAPCVAATLTFYPLFRAIVGGQNTALSLLCAAGAAAMLARDRDVAAGLWVGAWMFKPQYALPVGALIAVGGRPRVILGGTIAAGIWYLIGACVSGLAWPIWWWRGVAQYITADVAVDRGSGVSFLQMASELGVPVLGWLGVLATGALAVRAAWRSDAPPVTVVAAGAAAAVLMAPHALYYDGGLAVLGLAAASNVLGPQVVPVLVTSWLLAAAQVLRALLPFPPVTAVLVISLVLSTRASRLKADIRDDAKTTDPEESATTR
jgi:hypothetical protein